MTGSLKSTSEGGTLILTMSNPGFNNALGLEIYAAAIEALYAAETNPEIRSVVITGEGTVFGTDHNLGQGHASPEAQAQNMESLHTCIESIRTHSKPVLAAVEGMAADAAFSLALACDFLIAADNAVFIISSGELALSPQGGASWSLGHALPRALASELLMCGQGISAQRLHQLGLVNHVAVKGAALYQALELAEQLKARSHTVLSSIKELINEAPFNILNHQLASEHKHFIQNLNQ